MGYSNIVMYFASTIGTKPERLPLTQKTIDNIELAMQEFGFEKLKLAIDFAASASFLSPEKMSLPYIFTPGIIDRLIWGAKKQEMKRGYTWNVPPNMQTAEWLSVQHPA